ncbi:MAG: glycosyltransferase family 2 protein [Bacteroidia bacterium]|nr:glycosyltransferase family 2 protein [Bacteroidia bacterium]
MCKISVVITLYNEEENIQPLLKACSEALTDISYELILVDDGSTDKTVSEIHTHAYEQVKLIELMQNYGQSTAMAAGIDAAKGEYVVTMDGDLQNDPSDIPAMLERIENSRYDMIAGNRANRQDGFILRKLPSQLANRMIRFLTGVKIRDYGCTLKIFKSKIAKNLGLYGELHRFIPVLAKLQGARIAQMDVKHHPRQFGVSKYGIGRTFKVISDLILVLFFQKYLQKPMHIFGLWGFLIFVAGVLINFYMVYLKILGQDIWGRPLLVLGLMLTLGGIQLITIGLIVEVLMRTYYESQNKKTYEIREIYEGSAKDKKMA